MSTPEGRVKAKLKRILDAYRPQLYHHWPVQNGMGAPTLDCVGAICGRAFAIECKAPGEGLTERQKATAKTMIAAGIGVTIFCGTDDEASSLVRWLDYWRARGLVENGV